MTDKRLFRFTVHVPSTRAEIGSPGSIMLYWEVPRTNVSRHPIWQARIPQYTECASPPPEPLIAERGPPVLVQGVTSFMSPCTSARDCYSASRLNSLDYLPIYISWLPIFGLDGCGLRPNFRTRSPSRWWC